MERGEYAKAVLHAYRTAFDITVQAYGLTVPPSCSDQQFLKGFLRPDMGRLSELLPELYRLYEPVKFGKLADGDRDSLLRLLEKLYTETVLARAHDPLYQSSGPGWAAAGWASGRKSAYDQLFRSLPKGGKV